MEPRLDAEFYQSHFLAAERRVRSVPVKRFRSLWRNSNRIYIGIAGFTAKAEGRDYTPYIRPTDVGPHGEINWSRIAWCYAEWLEDYRDKGCAQPGDLLVEVKGNTRRVAVVDDRVPKDCIVSGSFWRLSLKEDTNPRFILAFLLSDTGQILKRRWVSNSVVSWIDPHSFRSFLIPVPDRRVQDYIGAKVELAERYRAVSSRMWQGATDLLAEALGVSLSPDTFELKSARDVSAPGYEVASIRPVIVRVEPGRLSGFLGAQFFTPRRAKVILVIDQSGLRLERLVDLADRFVKRIDANEPQRLGLTYIGLAQIDSTTGFISDTSDEQPTGSSTSFSARDILFSKLRPYLNKVAICPDHLKQAAGSTELVTYRAKTGVDPFYLFFVLKSPLVLNQVIDITSGSTHPRVDPGLIDTVLVPLVQKSTQKRIGESIQTSLETMRRATLLVGEAKADVEALLEDNLDVDAILRGELKVPTADDVPWLVEEAT